MDYEIQRKLDALDQKIDAIYISVEKTRKYFFWTMVITLVVIVVPLVAMMFVLPQFMNSYVGGIQGISGL